MQTDAKRVIEKKQWSLVQHKQIAKEYVKHLQILRTCCSLTAYASKKGTQLWNSLLICQVCYSYKHTEMPRVALAVDGCWSVGHWHAKWNFETISGNFRKPHRKPRKKHWKSELSWTILHYTKVRYIELLKHTSSILNQVTARAFLGTWHYIPGKTAGWHTNPKNLLQSTSLLRWGN